MRVLTAHQPVYLPWLGLLHKIAISDVYVSLDTAKYLKQDWNNRNKIKTPQGEHYLTVPVVKNSDKARLRDVHIANSRAWRRSHWLSIQNFYRKAPYFEVHFEFFEDVYDKEWEHLAKLNEAILRYFLQAFGIKRQFVRASDLGCTGRKNELLLNICATLQADTYIFGALGRNYVWVFR